MSGGSRLYVDISSHQGTPNLRAYWDAGYRELMMKASEGTGYWWPLMQQLARQWHSFGPDARVGYYHWLYSTHSAAAQHLLFWSRVQPVFRTGDWLMVDFEDVAPARWRSDADTLPVLREFVRFCRQHAETHVYSGNWYLANMPLCRAYLRSQLVVMSDYSHDEPGNPYGLTYVAHQFTDRAIVPGFAGPVDCNRWLLPLTGPGESAAGSGAPVPVPAEGGTDMPLSEQEWSRLTTIVNTAAGASAHAAATLVHQDAAGTYGRVADIVNNWLANDALVKRVCLGVGGALPGVPSTGHNLPGAEGQIRLALDAAATRIIAAMPSSSAGAVNLQPILDELAKLAGAVRDVPGDTRAAFTAQPLR